MTKTVCLSVDSSELKKLNERCSERMQIPNYGVGSFREFEVSFDNGYTMDISMENTEQGVFMDLTLSDQDGEIVQVDAHERIEKFDLLTMRHKNHLFKVEVVESITVGDRVRAFEMPDDYTSFIEGTVVEIGKPPQEIVPDTVNDYCHIRVDRRIINGEEVPITGGICYRPQNGSFLGRSFGRRIFSSSVSVVN